MTIPSGDSIANCVLKAFEALPAKCKPRIQGRREWVPLAGIVLSRDGARGDDELTCASLATGMKCLPSSKLGIAKGNILHDSHAEVLAIRGFNRFLLDECSASEGGGSKWVRKKPISSSLFALNPDIKIHMYTSQTPCGDASMELTMSSLPDSTPWAIRQQGSMLGRGNFDQLGVVRRKPARPDAPQTLSKSCSDKLAMKQCTGLLSGVMSLVMENEGTWLSTLVVPEAEYVLGKLGMERAWGRTGRMAVLEAPDVQKGWQGDYRFRPFEIRTTTQSFSFSKPPATTDEAVLPSNLSTLWTPHRHETLINGVLQGRKQLDPKGASCVSRRMLWRDVAALLGENKSTTYAEMKVCKELEPREYVKKDVRESALKGWIRNEGDEDWGLSDSG